MKPRVLEKTHLIATVVFFVGYLAAYAISTSSVVAPAADPEAVRPELLVTALFMALGGYAHACFMLGWRRATLFLGLCVVISFVAQVLLVHVLYGGGLRYTGVLGPKLLGVPLVVPLMWFMMTYPAYVMANLMLGGGLTWTSVKPWQLLWLSFLTAVIHAAWDLSRGPTMVHKFHAWSWADGGPYFGVPYNDVWVWVVVTFLVVLAYRVLELRVPLRPMGRTTAFVGLMPVAVYALSGLLDALGGAPTAVRIIVPFAMGIPVCLALDGLLDRVAAWRALADVLEERAGRAGR